MRIGTKLAIALVCAAVIPLAAASAVFLKTTNDVGRNIAEEGAARLANRVFGDMRRSLEFGTISLDDQQKSALQTARFLSIELADRLSNEGPADAAPSEDGEFLFGPLPSSGSDKGPAINLDHMSTAVATDAARDRIAETLSKLTGLTSLAKSVYLRNRDRLSHIVVALDSGLTFTYPAGIARSQNDAREEPWYLSTLEKGEPIWAGPDLDDPEHFVAAAPIQFGDGRYAGVISLVSRLDATLARSLGVSHLPADGKAYFLLTPKDDPQLLPHVVATLAPQNGEWRTSDGLLPVTLDGDDTWLKVVSDIRSGVPGMETVNREGNREVWAFGPAISSVDGELTLAVTIPAKIIEDVKSQATIFVESTFEGQLRNAIGFAVVAALLAVIAAIVGAKTLTQPIRQLRDAARALARGNFDVRVTANTSDELGDLSTGFNKMVPALEERLKQVRDLNIAREIQQHLMSRAFPSVEGYDIAGVTEYCDETGGDYLDWFDLDDKHVCLVIGDATGHGVGSALLMATARAALRTGARHHGAAIQHLITDTNQQLTVDSSGGRFVTMLTIAVDRSSGDLTWISAGHEPALIFDSNAGTFETLEGEGIPLGVDAEWRYESGRTSLSAGQILVGVTDGLLEAKRADGATYGSEGLQAALRAVSDRGSEAICRHLLEDVKAFLGEKPFQDDVTVLVMRRGTSSA